MADFGAVTKPLTIITCWQHHYSRTPRLVGNDEFPEKCLIDMRNNVIYNWGPVLGCYGGGGGSYNFVNNYYKPGPATNEKPAIAGRITQAGVDDTFFEHGVFYLSGNRFDYTSPYLGSKAQQKLRQVMKIIMRDSI